MSFVEAVARGFARTADFKGRSGRPEFWYFVLFVVLAAPLAAALDRHLAHVVDRAGPIMFAYVAALALPVAAVTIRRLHDISRSGWLLLFAGLPLIGLPVVLLLCALPGDKTPNAFGPAPG